MSQINSAITSAMASAASAVQSGASRINSTITAATTSASTSVRSGISQVNSAITAGGAQATAAVTAATTAIIGVMNRGAAQAAASGRQTGQGYASGIASGQGAASGAASGLVSAAVGTMSGGYGSAYAAGSYIGQGLANGLASQVGAVAAQAAALASAANAAIAAKAQIGSPSKITTKYGKWYGQGFINGINRMTSKAERASEKLVSFPTEALGREQLNFGSIDAELGADYSYDNTIHVTVVSQLDGREVARGTAEYDAAEQSKLSRRRARRYAMA
jgi:hypothetical protein